MFEAWYNAYMILPSDPYMLLSYVNTKLRDEFSSLEELCEELDVPQEELVSKLAAIGYCYEETGNRFVQI